VFTAGYWKDWAIGRELIERKVTGGYRFYLSDSMAGFHRSRSFSKIWRSMIPID
jgi:hypothetical protein